MGLVEAQRVAAYVFSALMADAGVGGVAALLANRIYRDRVPAAASLPAATVTMVSAVDVSTLGGVRVIETVMVDVRVIGEGLNYGPINPAADRIDTVLQNRGGVQSGVHVVELVRSQVQAFIEDDASGKTYCHIVQTFATPSYALP